MSSASPASSIGPSSPGVERASKKADGLLQTIRAREKTNPNPNRLSHVKQSEAGSEAPLSTLLQRALEELRMVKSQVNSQKSQNSKQVKKKGFFRNIFSKVFGGIPINFNYGSTSLKRTIKNLEKQIEIQKQLEKNREERRKSSTSESTSNRLPITKLEKAADTNMLLKENVALLKRLNKTNKSKLSDLEKKALNNTIKRTQEKIKLRNKDFNFTQDSAALKMTENESKEISANVEKTKNYANQRTFTKKFDEYKALRKKGSTNKNALNELYKKRKELESMGISSPEQKQLFMLNEYRRLITGNGPGAIRLQDLEQSFKKLSLENLTALRKQSQDKSISLYLNSLIKDKKQQAKEEKALQ